MSSSNGNRTVHGITWRDDLAWMEPMKGPAWEARVHEEQKRYAGFVQQPAIRKLIHPIREELEEGFEVFSRMLFRDGDAIEIGEVGTYNWKWRFLSSSPGPEHQVGDVCSDGKDCVWTAEEGGKGDESYSVCFYRRGREEPVWRHSGVGPHVAVVKGRCFALEVRNRLICWRLVSWDAQTGKDRQVHYELDDYRYNLELVRAENNIFLKQQAGAKLDVFCLSVEGKLETLDGISLDPRKFVLGSRRSDYIVWTAAHGWQASACLAWKLPPLSEQGANPEVLDTIRGFLITKSKGRRTLWKIWNYKKPEELWRGIGLIKIDPWSGSFLRFTQPGQKSRWWDSASNKEHPSPFLGLLGGEVKGGAPYVLVPSSRPGNPKGLFLIAYGAYGIPTELDTKRWEPFRRRGWMIGILLLRGGGDDSPQWEDSGRVHGRVKVLEEAEITVRAIQERVGLGPEATCLYGRSAGGLWAGGLAAKYPKGDLARHVYMEVPYLDVLRTITNRTLPLTDIETDEFGLPEQRLSDLIVSLRWSPMELLAMQAGAGIPGVWQLVRTGLNDSQVYAYESMKWITRSRGPFSVKAGESRAILAIEGDQGHFVNGATGFQQKAMDIAILLALNKKSHI